MIIEGQWNLVWPENEHLAPGEKHIVGQNRLALGRVEDQDPACRTRRFAAVESHTTSFRPGLANRDSRHERELVGRWPTLQFAFKPGNPAGQSHLYSL